MVDFPSAADSSFKRITIYIGGYYAAKEPAVIKTVLGSCIAVCLFENKLKFGGMNHFMLPEMKEWEKPEDDYNHTRYGLFAMEVLINEILKLGGKKENLTAKIFGGGHVLTGMTSNLLHLYGVKNWEILKRREHANILNSFLWGNATAIERWESDGIPEGTNPQAHQIARNAAYELNDFKHLQTIFAPDVSIIMCGKGPCHQFLRNIDKELLWERDNVCLWKTGKSFIFSMPHPNNMKFNNGADSYAKTIREGLIEHGLFQSMPEFIDCDKEAEQLLDTFFSKCKSQARNTKEAVAFIATELRKHEATMTVRMLCNILNKLGYRTTYGSEYVAGRGSYKMVAGAWNYYQNYLKQPDIAESIALAFTKPNGDYAYWDY